MTTNDNFFSKIFCSEKRLSEKLLNLVSQKGSVSVKSQRSVLLVALLVSHASQEWVIT
jgi:hypothetical protein